MPKSWECDMGREKFSLNNIAALIIQIEPNDLGDLAPGRQALIPISESSPASVQRPIAEAIRKIDQMIKEKASDSSGFLADLGALIEEAIEAKEDSNG